MLCLQITKKVNFSTKSVLLSQFLSPIQPKFLKKSFLFSLYALFFHFSVSYSLSPLVISPSKTSPPPSFVLQCCCLVKKSHSFICFFLNLFTYLISLFCTVAYFSMLFVHKLTFIIISK